MAAEACKSRKRTLFELYGEDDDDDDSDVEGPVASKLQKIRNAAKDEEIKRKSEECGKGLGAKEVCWISMVDGLLRESEQKLRTIEEESDARLKLIDAQVKERDLQRRKSLKLLQEMMYQFAQELEKKAKQHGEEVRELEGKEKQLEGRFKELRKKEEELDARWKLMDRKAKEEELQRKKSLLRKIIDEIALEREKKEKQRECELRVKELESMNKRVMELESKGEEFERQMNGLESKRKHFEGRVKEIESIEVQLEARVKDLESKEKHFKERVKELNSKEKQFEFRVKELESNENNFEERAKELLRKERQFEGRVIELESKDKVLEGQLKDLKSKGRELEGQWENLESKKKHFDGRVKEIESIEVQLEARVKDLESKEKHFKERVKELNSKEKQLEFRVKELESNENNFEEQMKELLQKERLFEGKVKELESKQKKLGDRAKKLELKENNVEVQTKELKSKEKQFEAQVKEIKFKEKQFEVQAKKKLQSKEKQFEGQVNDLESKQNQFEGQLKDLKLKEKQYEALIKSSEEEKVPDKQLSPATDGRRSLQMLSNVQTKETELLVNTAVLINLKTSSDPAKLVLDMIQNPLFPHYMKGGNVVIVDTWQIFLLEQLMKLSPHIKPHVRDEAMRLALDLKAYIRASTENSLVVLSFLLLMSIYGLGSYFNEDEVLKFFEFASQHKLAIEVFRTLGFADKAHDFVQHLIKKQKHIEAIGFICAYNLVEKNQPVDILREYVRNAKLIHVRSCKETKSIEIKVKAINEEIASLETALQCISDNNIESLDLHKEIQDRIRELKRKKANYCVLTGIKPCLQQCYNNIQSQDLS